LPDSTSGSTRDLTSGRAARAIGGERQFLRGHDLHELVGGNTAIFFGKAEAEQADRGRLRIEIARKFASLIPFMGMRLDFLLDKAAHHRAPGLMLGRVERALHAIP
jgi:hypothetical protein